MHTVADRKVPPQMDCITCLDHGECTIGLGLNLEEVLRRSSFRSSATILLSLEYPCDVLLTLQNDDTNRYPQADTPSCESNEHLNVSIPPLDALIIPKVVCDCKTMHNLYSKSLQHARLYHVGVRWKVVDLLCFADGHP